MFAVVVSGSITSFPKGNKGLVVGDVKHPKTIFTLWTEAERNAIGVYTVEIDETNRKDEKFYTNTDISYAFGSGKVTGSYGTATAKTLADANAKDENGDDLDPVEVIKGLKTQYKDNFNAQAAGLLAPTDWYVVKATEVSGYSVPSAITTYRAAVRTKINAMETAIDNCANVDALITLLTYTTDSDGVSSRPLGEFPDEVV
jgi:aminoglycoside phosphotransferase family enzyme